MELCGQRLPQLKSKAWSLGLFAHENKALNKTVQDLYIKVHFGTVGGLTDDVDSLDARGQLCLNEIGASPKRETPLEVG
jgi:hypothetical protein